MNKLLVFPALFAFCSAVAPKLVSNALSPIRMFGCGSAEDVESQQTNDADESDAENEPDRIYDPEIEFDMTTYFQNLYSYSPLNSSRSCGYVSLKQCLSYYDTFHTHNYAYTYVNSMYNRVTCSCGVNELEPHIYEGGVCYACGH